MEEENELEPLAFLGHTHSLGTLVQLYRVREKRWDLLGEVLGNQPQSFYSVKNLGLKKGDWLAGRCWMKSSRRWDTKHGLSSQDEMCNIYLVYRVHGNLLKGNTHCITQHGTGWQGLGLRTKPHNTV